MHTQPDGNGAALAAMAREHAAAENRAHLDNISLVGGLAGGADAAMGAAGRAAPGWLKGAGQVGNVGSVWSMLHGAYKLEQAGNDGLAQWDGASDIALGAANFIPAIGPVISAAGSLGKWADNTLGISDALAGVSPGPQMTVEPHEEVMARADAACTELVEPHGGLDDDSSGANDRAVRLLPCHSLYDPAMDTARATP